MKAFVLEYGDQKMKEMEDPVAEQNEVVVSLRAAGLNRRDLYIPNRWGSEKEALILGSDGAGVVESVGQGVKRFKIGDEVILNPSLHWYENTDAPPSNFDIIGMPGHGTFAEKIVISEEQLEPKPAHLTWEEAGVLALSALTGYRAMFTKGNLKPGETVFIPGAGGGVVTYLIQFAKNIGAKVIVTSRDKEKQRKAKELGADIAIDTNSDWKKELVDEVVDLVIESVGGDTFNRSLDILKKGGRMVTFGSSTEDVVPFDLRKFFYGQYKFFGSTMGSREELRGMIKHIETYNMQPVVDRTFPLDEAQEALGYIRDSKQFGKVAISIE